MSMAGLFGASPAGRPFAHRPREASQALQFGRPPEFGVTATTLGPLRAELDEIGVERTLSRPEDFALNAPDHMPDELPATPGLAVDLLRALAHYAKY